MSWSFTVWINFANSQTSASNFQSFSWSLEQLFLTGGQKNFGKKIPLQTLRRTCLDIFHWNKQQSYKFRHKPNEILWPYFSFFALFPCHKLKLSVKTFVYNNRHSNTFLCKCKFSWEKIVKIRCENHAFAKNFCNSINLQCLNLMPIGHS